MIPLSWTPIANHLWQSTIFAGFAGLLTLLFRTNRAPVRYSLWLAASLKFLVPFSLLVSLGSQFGWRTATPVARPLISSVQEVAIPFVPSAIGSLDSKPHTLWLPYALLALWFCGFAISLAVWLRQWARVRASLRDAQPLSLDAPIPVLSTPGRLEPGVFGIWRQVLLLPHGIVDRLTPAQLRAVLLHEACHARRLDNLTAALHMLVESLFWFHPLVWYIRQRLIDERERACDEEVLRLAADPEQYAESLLHVCRLYLETPLVCVSGVTGSNLKRRIREIMTPRIIHQLTPGRKLLLAAAAAAAIITPILLGMLAPALLAQSSSAPLAFEVASIKPNAGSEQRFLGGMQVAPDGRLRVEAMPLRAIIASAYDVPFQSMRLSGGPDWIRAERYDIDARPAAGVVTDSMSPKVRDEKVTMMLRTLLADRFGLVIRRDDKDIPIYAVTVGKNGLKLKKAAVQEKDCATAALETPCHAFQGGMGRGMHSKAASIHDIITWAENWSDRPIIDKANVEGLFEVETEGWMPMIHRDPAATSDEGLGDPTRPTLAMIFDRMGLKLEPQKGPADMYVIEKVSRPTGN